MTAKPCTAALTSILVAISIVCLLTACSNADDDDDDDNDIDDDVDDDDDDVDDDDDDDEDDDDEEPPPDCEGGMEYPTSPNIIRGPYLQHVTLTSARIVWQTDAPGNTIVKWGPDENLGWSFCYWDPSTHHEVELVGLKPGQTSRYIVRSDGAQSEMHSFHTAAPVNTPFSFAAMADNHVAPDIHGQIVDLVMDASPDLVIYAGDITNNGLNFDDFDNGFFGPGAPLFADTPFYTEIGNHEKESPYYYELMSLPGNEKWYSFTYGNTRFIGLDPNWIYVPGSLQYDWFEQELIDANEDPDVEWIVVYAHQPPYCEGWGNPGYNGEPGVRLLLVPLFEEYDVDVFFSGHAHDYEQGELNGVTYIILGGAGGGLDSWQQDFPHITVYEAVHHFVKFDVDGKTMNIEAIRIDGTTIEQFTLTH